MLTGGTSEGEATHEDASISVYSGTSKSTSKEPWKLVQKRKLGSKQKPAEDTEYKEETNLPAEGGGISNKATTKLRTDPAIAVRTASRPTYDKVTLELGREGEEESSNKRTPKAYFSKAKPTGATYAQCLGQARAPLGATRGPRRQTKKKAFTMPTV